MKIAMIGCPFQTAYGAYIKSLASGLEREIGQQVQWIGSNCGCDDAAEQSRTLQRLRCDYVEMPIVNASQSSNPLKRWIRNGACNGGLHLRALRFAKLQQGAQVVHFHQTQHAFGSNAVFHWLRQASSAARLITVHELDSYQLEHRGVNQTYNQAEGVIVHSAAVKHQLVELGVHAGRIHVLLHGAELTQAAPEPNRADLVFYGGQRPGEITGIDSLFAALAIVVMRLGSRAPRLRIHGHYGHTTPIEYGQLAWNYQIANQIDWLNQISMVEMARLYAKSALCILPYTGGFAGLPASVAAAHGLPVLGTLMAGLPEHLGDSGLWLADFQPQSLAEQIVDVLQKPALRLQTGAKLRARAAGFLSWDVIARQTLSLYHQALAAEDAHLTRFQNVEFTQ